MGAMECRPLFVGGDDDVSENGVDADNVDVRNLASELTYIDHCLHEIEKDGEEDSSWSPSADEDSDQERLDDELEYDSEEDSIVQIEAKGCQESALSREEFKGFQLWRLPKEDSFSDWTIMITETKEEGTKAFSYHVHRSALAVGPRKSGYFEVLFKGGQFRENANRISSVSLSEEVSEAVPAFLDYMYSGQLCFIEKENWLSLKVLGDYFDVPRLTEDILEFIEQDMYNLENMVEYLSEFTDMECNMSKRILRSTSQVCAEMILSIEAGSSLLRALSPAMFLHIISSVMRSSCFKSMPCADKNHVCQLVVDYIKHHRNILNEYYFQALAAELQFPDDIRMAGLLSIEMLEVIKLTRWEQNHDPASYESMKCTCKMFLSRYLVNEAEPTRQLTSSIIEKSPDDIAAAVFREALMARKASETEEITISCKITGSMLNLTTKLKTLGSVVKISAKPTDSVEYVMYRLKRSLSIPSLTNKLTLYYQGSKLDREQTVSSYAISTDSLLQVYR